MTRCRRLARGNSLQGLLLGTLLSACDGEPAPSRAAGDAGEVVLGGLTRAELLDPLTCKSCHPKHYREWSGSMHAYAAEDPVFIAMNQRGQRETKGALGDFCVKCHAPMAVREDLTRDGLNLRELPAQMRGVTCYFCHNATDVVDDHNAALSLANDTTMRGALDDARTPSAHGVAYSKLHDRRTPDSSRLCGSCHDVVTPAGVHLERTFKEYRESAYAREGVAFQSCQTCHMDGRRGKAAVAGADDLPERVIHEHLWPGVDIALSDFPDREAHRLAVECALASSATIVSLAATPSGDFKVAIETEAGHAQPSGTSQDRRLWVEFVAYDEAGNVVYESAVATDEAHEPEVPRPPLLAHVDPRPTLFHDRIFDASGNEAHMFWDAQKSSAYPEGYSSLLLLPPVQFAAPHTVFRTYTVPSGLPARARVRLRLRPVAHEILQDLVSSGDLDASVLAQVPTFTLQGTVMEWTRADGFTELNAPEPSSLRCPDAYRCLLDASEEGCVKR